jgi:hypothetical protein
MSLVLEVKLRAGSATASVFAAFQTELSMLAKKREAAPQEQRLLATTGPRYWHFPMTAGEVGGA